MAKTTNTEALITPANEAQLLNLYNALNQNNDTFSQKIKVVKLKRVEGKVKTDKDGNTQVDDFGEPLRWDDRYFLTYIALNAGGEHTTDITQAQFQELSENETYIASGRIEYRLYKDNFNTTPAIVFSRFENAAEYFVSAALKLGFATI